MTDRRAEIAERSKRMYDHAYDCDWFGRDGDFSLPETICETHKNTMWLLSELTRLTAESDAAQVEVERLTERIKAYRAKLEVDRHWQGKGKDGLQCVYLPFDQDEPYDGIDCRNETIKLQDERIVTLTADLERMRAALSDIMLHIVDEQNTDPAEIHIQRWWRRHAQALKDVPRPGSPERHALAAAARTEKEEGK